MGRLHWFVLNYDFNAKKVENFDIFRSVRFSEGVEKLMEDTNYNYESFNLEEFKGKLKSELMYSFWSKRQYEISVGDAFDTNLDNYEKIDVYRQAYANIDALAEYIILNMGVADVVDHILY